MENTKISNNNISVEKYMKRYVSTFVFLSFLLMN